MTKNQALIHMRRERWKRNTARQIAWLSVLSAVALLGIGFGCMVATADDRLFTVLSVSVVTAGIIGAKYIATRH